MTKACIARVSLGLIIAALLVFPACGGSDDGARSQKETPGSAAIESPPSGGTTSPEPTIDPNPPGWTRYPQDSYALSLPASYIGGAANDATLQAIRDLGANCAATADLFAEQPEAVRRPFVFMAVDAQTCEGSVKSMQVLEVPGAGASSPDAFMDDFVEGLPGTAELIERREGTIGGAPAAVLRVTRRYDNGTVTSVQQIYAVRGEGSWFMFVAAALEADFAAVASEFAAIAETMRVE